jgi:copper transport outer membrane protein MctB
MFDFRYHALSLSAVIVALVLGVLLGVAIGDRGLVSSGEKAIREDLRHKVASAQSHADDLQGQLDDRKSVLGKVYPLLVANQLQDRDVGIVYLGSKSNTDKDLVTDAIGPAGAHLTWLMAIHEPLDAGAVARHAQGTQYAQLANDPTLYENFGRRIGIQLVDGGQLVKREQSTISDAFDGDLRPVGTVVLVHDPPTNLDATQSAAMQAFERGVVEGLKSGATVVGVQTETTSPSQTGWYGDQGLTYVSDLDQVEGRISLIYALSGQSQGSFGPGQVPDLPSTNG